MPATPTKNSIAPPLEVGGANDALHIIIPGGKVVAWIDSQGYGQGHLFSTATVPGGSSGNIQANNNGVFAGIPGSSVDFTNGLTGLAATGTGIALTVKGDAHSNIAIEVLDSAGVAANGLISATVPTGGGTSTLLTAGKNPSGTGTVEAEGFTAAGAANTAKLDGTNVRADINLNCHTGDNLTAYASSDAVDITLLDQTSGGASVNLQATGGITGVNLIDQSGLLISLEPGLGMLPPLFTVATLPSVGISEGYIAYATNGRKVGEGGGSGTGVPVYFSNSEWRVFSTDAQVQS